MNNPSKHISDSGDDLSVYLPESDNQYRTVYQMKNKLKSKKSFYIKLFFLLAVINLTLIITVFGQTLTIKDITVTNSSLIQVNGDTKLEGTTSVQNTGVIDIKGDFINNGNNTSLAGINGFVILSGGTQYITGTSSTQFYNLTIKGTGTKILQQNISVGGNALIGTGILNFDGQNLDLNAFELTVMNSTPWGIVVNGGFAISETGPVPGYGTIKWVIRNQTGTYTFPFGNSASNSYLPVTFNVKTPGSGINGNISVSTYPTVTSAAPNNRPLPLGLSSLMNSYGTDTSSPVLDRWWLINAQSYLSTPVTDITFTYRDSEHNNSAGSTNTITEGLLQAQSSNGSIWTAAPSGSVNTSVNTVTVTNEDIYNPYWTLVGSSSPLPVELLSFDVTLNRNNESILSWITATEINNDYFMIEKSMDGLNFSDFRKVTGAGNSSSAIQYTEIDHAPFRGITYYRLRQTDFDGSINYSDIKSVRMNDQLTNDDLQIYPVPAADHVFISTANINDINTLYLSDALGNTVSKIEITSDKLKLPAIRINRNNLPSGVYFLTSNTGLSKRVVFL